MKNTKKKKSSSRRSAKRGVSQTIKLRKTPQAGELPRQAAGILAVLKARGGNVAVAALTKAMEGRITTKQSMAAIWRFYRSRLVKEGYVSIATEKGGQR